MDEKGPKQEIIFEADKNGFVSFGDVSRRLMGKQAQYGAKYVDGAFGEYPKLGDGLRIEGDSDDYHNLKIHKDDVAEFVRRYK